MDNSCTDIGERMRDHAEYQAGATALAGSWELCLIAALLGFLVADRKAWQTHPILASCAVFVFLVGLHPGLDAVARHSVWLHSLQSLMIHHLGPMLLLLAGFNPFRSTPRFNRGLGSTPAMLLVILSFIGMTLLWLSPGLHLSLMESARLYSVMKWSMALSGLLLCNLVTAPEWNGLRRRTAINIAVALPQSAVGLYLTSVAPLYAMPGCIMPPPSWLPLLDPFEDQFLGGALLIVASALFFLPDATGRMRHPTEALPAET